MTSPITVTRTWAESSGLETTFTETTGSTNDDAKRDAPARDHEHLYLTMHQTSGRGRGVNAWADVGAGKILLSTWTFPLSSAPQAITGPRLGLALRRAVRAAWPDLPWSLKAPNDLYLGALKCAGLLIEVVTSGLRPRVLVGLGLNVLGHPPEVATATDLAGSLGRPPGEDEWRAFLDAWLTELRAALAEIVSPTLSPAARRELRLALNAFPGRSFDVVDVTPEGDLVHAAGVVRWTDL